MGDLIDRQAAIDEIKALYKWHDIVTEDRAIDHFKRLPSAEVEPVKRGKWEEKTVNNCRIDEWQSARCSVCGRYHTTPCLYYFTGSNYCPNCGAKMEGEEVDG